MNLNLLSYLLFFPAMLGIAVCVAQVCHRHGRIWMLRIFDNEAPFVDAVNNVLLVGCYVVNAGYIALVVGRCETISALPQMLGTLSQHVAVILFSLAALHYQNIAVLLVWSHLKHRKTDVPGFRVPGSLAAVVGSSASGQQRATRHTEPPTNN